MTKPIDTTEIRTRLDSQGWSGMHPVDIMQLCDEIDRMRGVQQTPPQGKTVEVRVAVAVGVDGTWHAVGYTSISKKHAEHAALSQFVDGVVVHWLTATLPVPAEVEVVARVEGE